MSTTSQYHILIVDDDAISLAAIANMLHDLGYQTTSVDNGTECLTLLQSHPRKFDAVILDRMMPKVSGIDVLHKIWMKKTLQHIPIIMLTSHAEREDVSAAVIAGVFDFVYKPIDEELLKLVLKRAIDSKVAKS